MTADDQKNNEQEAEVLTEPLEADNKRDQNFLALISNYTDRPDLMIAEIEKHDPGFVQRMSAASERHAEQIREGKFSFGRRQAYLSLFIQTVAALSILVLLSFAVVNSGGFWTIIGLVIFFAVSQGGRGGFMRVIDACAKAISRVKSGGSD